MSGDFPKHCDYLAEATAGFTTWARLETLKPSIFPPALDVSNSTSVVEHCYPSLRRIIDSMDIHFKRKPHIRTVYFLHDGAFDHMNVYIQLYKLEAALKSAERFKRAGLTGGPMETIVDSGMLPVQRGERDWKVAVDMELARRAEVFVGNGYSSLSSEVAALRLADGGSPLDIGFT